MKKQTSRAKTTAKSKATAAKTTKSRKTIVVAKKKTAQRKGLIHHTKRIYRLTPKFVHGMLIGGVIGIAAVATFGTTGDAHANPAANPCIQTQGGININDKKANVDVRTKNCNNGHSFMMKMWYADSASGKPHETQRLFDQSEIVDVGTNAGWKHLNVKMPADGCFYQADLVDVTHPASDGNGNPIVVSATGGNHNCNPVPDYRCVAIHAVADSTRTVTIDQFNYVAKNVTFTRATVDWGDQTVPLTSSIILGKQHQYAVDKTYTLTVTAYFNVQDKNDLEIKEKAAPACTFPIPVSTTPTQPGNQQVCELKTGAIVTIPEGTYDTTLYGPTSSEACNKTVTVTNTGSGGQLTKTGPGAVLVVLLFATVGGYAYHHAHRHIKTKKHHKRAH